VSNAEDVPVRITGAWLNGLSREERIAVMQGPFGRRMHAWAGSHVTYFRWATPTIRGPRINNGSAFFLDFGGRLLLVAAAHVYRVYISATLPLGGNGGMRARLGLIRLARGSGE
jgi:hypothetical protein